MELLVVIAIITTFVGVIGYGFLRGSASSTVGLQAAQSMIVALLTQARSQAILTGREVRLLVNNNDQNSVRYRRFLCVVVRNAANEWEPIDAGVYLPERVYLVPRSALDASEVDGGDWSGVNSTALQISESALSIEASDTALESWIGTGFTPRGTTSAGVGGNPIVGRVVLAIGRPQSESPGQPPFLYTNPENVRGVAITSYGLMRMLNTASDF